MYILPTPTKGMGGKKGNKKPTSLDREARYISLFGHMHLNLIKYSCLL